MKTKFFTAVLFSIALMAGTTSIFTQGKMMKNEKMNNKMVMVGGAEMYPTKNY